MTREEFVAWAKARGWKEDRYGHLHRMAGNAEEAHYRYKISRIAVRREVKTSGGWVRLKSAYFKDLSVDPGTGKLVGMSRRGAGATSR